MSILVVGGDQIVQITDLLKNYGATDIIHYTARTRESATKKIPQDTDYVVMLTSFLSHSSMKFFKGQAKKRGIPIIAAQRNLPSLNEALGKRFKDGKFQKAV
ncbi:MAG: DUF2325 domain-containing protein [Helicobacteraceae bacterium]